MLGCFRDSNGKSTRKRKALYSSLKTKESDVAPHSLIASLFMLSNRTKMRKKDKEVNVFFCSIHRPETNEPQARGLHGTFLWDQMLSIDFDPFRWTGDELREEEQRKDAIGRYKNPSAKTRVQSHRSSPSESLSAPIPTSPHSFVMSRVLVSLPYLT